MKTVDLRAVWRRVHAWAAARSKLVPRLSLLVDCPEILKNRRTDRRAFFHVGHRPGKVCTVRDAAKLSVNHVVGLMLHELGHPMATKAFGQSEQGHADGAVSGFLGVKIQYKSPLVLQWVPDKVVRGILG